MVCKDLQIQTVLLTRDISLFQIPEMVLSEWFQLLKPVEISLNIWSRYLASRLVKSSDSHASDPCSRLGGSSWLCCGIISWQSSMKCEKFISGATLLSEGELESTWHCSIQKILQSSTKSRIRPRTMGKMGQTNHEAMRKGKHWQALRQGDESLCNLLERPLQWAGERKTPWGKPGERYKHRWGKVRQASRWGPWKFRPSTAYGAFPPHTQWFITSSWPLGG